MEPLQNTYTNEQKQCILTKYAAYILRLAEIVIDQEMTCEQKLAAANAAYVDYGLGRAQCLGLVES
jgi:hypothetical protein